MIDIVLALNHPVYDCLYLACAETVEGILITADRKLCRSVHGSEFESLIKDLKDVDVSDDGG